MKQTLRLWLTAVQFYSRIPVPQWVGYTPEQLNQSTPYFVLVGTLIGAITAAVLMVAAQRWTAGIAAALALAAGTWLTGAFHEDGFCDSCDGLGGGFTPARVLEIMKDSRVGSYAVVGFGLLLLITWNALASLAAQPRPAAAALLLAHVLSRAAALLVMKALPYAREQDAASKIKPVTTALPARRLWLGLAFTLPALAAALAVLGWPHLLAALLAVALPSLWMTYTLHRKIGGYTGDGLGATQQLAFAAVLLAAAARF